MRELVLALTLALVAGHAAALTDLPIGKTYIYKYEAEILGGLPEQGLARAGLKVSSKVLISAGPQNIYLLKLVEPELFEYSGIWPKDAYIPATKLTKSLAPQLLTPIKFEYTNGVVGKLEAPEGISTLVMNIHRGILNILQLNIKKTQNVYEMQEAGAQGVCKTLYAITEDEKAERILLTKTRDLNHCHERVIKDIGLAYTEKLIKNQQNLKGASAYNYILKPSAHGWLIMNAVVNELIQFTPFTEMNGAAQMETKQTLVFLEVENAPIVPIQAPYINQGSIKYKFSTELLQTPLQLIKVNNVQTQIVEILNHLVINNVAKVHEDAPLKFLELIQVLRAAHLADLEMLWTQYKDRPAFRKWILEAIPVIGTPAALRFIKEKFMADQLTVVETAQALIASVHMVTANTEVIKLVEELAVSPKILNHAVLREIVLLGYGTMVNKYCVENIACPVELIKPIQDLLAEAVQKQDTENMILLLKVLGNAGHHQSVKPITKILPIHGTAATALPLRVHSEAIMALRNIAKKEPRMIQDLALQIYMDKALHPELRMLACIVLFETRPPVGLVTSVASIVKAERNLQVASFTYSYMKSLARSNTVAHNTVSTACNVAVKILNPILGRLNMRFSKAVYADIYNNPLMLGAAATAFYINDVATVLPKSVVAKTSAFLAGAAADILELGVRTEGLQEAILKNPAIIKSQDRITKMKRVIQALSQWRSEPHRNPLASLYVKFFGQEIAFVNIDKALVDQIIELTSAPALREMGWDALKTVLNGANFQVAKPMLATEVRRIMPTAAGLPMELSLYTAAVAAASVHVRATTTPELGDHFQLAHLMKTDVQLETEIKPSVAMNTFAVMGINTAVIQAALLARAKINSILPAKIVARLNINDGQFKIQALPVSAPEEVATAHVETFAVARNIEDLTAVKITPLVPVKVLEPLSSQILTSTMSSAASSQLRSSEILVDQFAAKNIVKPKVAEFRKKYCVGAIGLKGCIRVATHNAAYISDTALYKLAGKHSFVISWQHEGEALERLEIEIQVGPKAAEKLIKQINLSEEELVETNPVLMKLNKILAHERRNSTSSSSSRSSKSSSVSSQLSSVSSSSRSKRSSTTSSSSSSSSRKSSISSSSSSSRRSSRSSSSSSRISSSRSVSRASRSSSASSLASLFSASSSSSRSSVQSSKAIIYNQKFKKNHKKQGLNSQAVSVSRSASSASFEAIYRKNKFLGNEVAPIFAVIVRAVRANKMMHGYQLAVYLDKPNARAQLILANLASDNNWKLCADGALLSKFKVSARVAWGAECRQYETKLTAETGLLGPSPAARARLTWTKLPSDVVYYAKKIYSLIPADMLASFTQGKDEKSPEQLSLTVVAKSDRIIEFIWKTPMRIVYKMSLHLPIAVPLPEFKGLPPMEELAKKAHFLLTSAAAAECSWTGDTVTTFNNRRYKNVSPLSCYQVLAQDCTDELKFMVLLKKDHLDQSKINVKIADIDIDLFMMNDRVAVRVNGKEIPQENLPYQHPTAQIQIRPDGEGISVHDHTHGLPEVYFDRNTWKIKVADWMRGKTCGLCGKADGEVRQEYRTPSGRLTKNAVSYAHSWVLPAENCKDATECRMKLESVQLQKQVNIHGQESQCYSVEPVLRCVAGCLPVKTTAVTVGFHCLPADTAVSQDRLRNIYDESVDLRETTEAHLACKCTAQCA